MSNQNIQKSSQIKKVENSLNKMISSYCSIILLRKEPFSIFNFSSGAISQIHNPILSLKSKMNQKENYGPLVWVAYHEQIGDFGISYMLNSNAVGMIYNDSTCFISSFEFNNFKYFNKVARKQNPSQLQQVYTQETIPKQLAKKFKIINIYKNRLKSKKEKDEEKMCNEQMIQKKNLRFRETAETMMQVFVVKCKKRLNVTIFWFNNKDCQLIFKDSTELLLSKNQVTYVNKVGNRKYLDKQQLQSQPQEIKKKMEQAVKQLKRMEQWWIKLFQLIQNLSHFLYLLNLLKDPSLYSHKKQFPHMQSGFSQFLRPKAAYNFFSKIN